MKTIRNIALLCICALMLNACKTAKVGEVNTPKNPHLQQLAAIPNNALFVLELNGTALREKSALNTPEKFRMWAAIEQELKSEPVPLRIMTSFLKDEYPLGLNIDKIYLYSTKENIEQYGVLVIKMHDISAFEREIVHLDVSEIKSAGNFKLLSTRGISLLWNNDILLFVMGRFDIDNSNAIRHSEATSIITNTDYLKFAAKKFDAGVWVRYDEVLDLMEANMFGDSLKNTFVHMYTSFENGKANTTITAKDQYGKPLFAHEKLYNKNFTKNLLNIYPEKTFFSAIISVNPTTYINFIKKHVANYFEEDHYDYEDEVAADITNEMLISTVEEEAISDTEEDYETSDVDGEEDYESYEDYNYGHSTNYSEIMDSVAKWAKYFGGDAVINVYGFAKGMIPMPLAGLSFNVKGEQAFLSLLSMLPKDMIKKEGDLHYIAIESFLVFYFGYKDNIVTITNDSEIIKEFIAGRKQAKSFATNQYNYNIDNMGSSMYLNLDIDQYPENIRIMVIQYLRSKTGLKDVSIITNFLKGIYIRGDKNEEGVFNVEFKNEEKNSLQQIFELIDEISSNAINNSYY